MKPAGRRLAAAALALGVLLSALPALASGEGALPGSTVETAPQAGGAYHLRVVSYRDLPFRTVVRQQYDYSCGSAALATLLRYHYGRAIGEAEVFKAMWAVGDKPKIQKVGFSLLDMKRYLERLGYVADGYRAPLELLAKTKIPAIAVVNVGRYKHFVVVKGISGGQVLVGDPAEGLKVYRLSEFKKAWDGAFFVIHGGRAAEGRFNLASEWGQVPHGPIDVALQDQFSISDLTRDLPLVFQITPVIQLAGGGAP